MSAETKATKRLVALHGWSATALAILLYVIMLTGTIVVLDNEINGWAEGRAGDAPVFTDRTDDIVHRFAAQAPPELHDTVFLGRGSGATLNLFFGAPKPHPDGGTELFGRHFLVHPATGVLQTARAGFFSETVRHRPEAALADFLVDLHVRLHVPGRLGLYLTGLLGITMLVAAITGVLIHKHILRDLFTTERPGARLVSFRDRHTLAGVWSLPFAVLLSFTGAFLSFAISLGLPVVALVAFAGDQEAAIATVLGEPAHMDITRVQTTDIAAVFADAAIRAGTEVGGAQIHHYGTASGTIETFHPAADGALTGTTLEYSAATGAFLRAPEIVGTAPSVGSTIAELMAPLHFGNFAGWWSRVIWVGLGGAMTYTIVSGMQLWLRRRQDDPAWQHGSRALSLVAWGLPLAIAITAHVFLLTYLTGDPYHWTPRIFVWSIIGLLVLGIATQKWTLDDLNRMLGTALGALLIALPVMRLQTGGLSWGEALLWGGDEVLVIDGTCIGLGFYCLAVLRRKSAQVSATSPAK